MNIIMASAEIYPLAKAGGLADVASALPKALKGLGHDISLVMPMYRMVKEQNLKTELVIDRLDISLGGGIETAKIYKVFIHDNIPVYLIDNDKYYDRSGIYGNSDGDYSDSLARFSFFAKGVLEICRHLKYKPDIIHCNDWHTGLIPAYLKYFYNKDTLFKDTKTIFTIHNVAYQGVFPADEFYITELSPTILTDEGIAHEGNINMLKGGIVFSDAVNTVSTSYSKEIQTAEFGSGLHEILKKHSVKLCGILNGVDYDEWSPEKDTYIRKRYDKNDIDGKVVCKKDLFSTLKISEDCIDMPVIGVISRLAWQKGFELIENGIEEILSLGAIFVLLGEGEERYHNMFKNISDRYPKEVRIVFGFDTPLSHKIEAGADFFLMPSRYEPCGLNQMYSMRYGTIPIVRGVGGLNDTVYESDGGKVCNGFKFYDYDHHEMISAIKRGFSLFKDKDGWKRLIVNAMSYDYSWEKSAKEYERVYEHIIYLRK